MGHRQYWEYDRSTAGIQVLVDFGAQLGLSAETLLAGTGLEPKRIHDVDRLISAVQELAVARRVRAAAPNDVAAGLDLGARYRFSSYGLFGLGLLSSATLGDAIKFAMRFLPLTFAFTTISARSDEKQCVLNYSTEGLPYSVRNFLVARDVAASALLLQEVVPDIRATRITLDGNAEKSVKRRLLGVDVEIGAERTQLSFGASYLTKPLATSSQATAVMCEKACQAAMRERMVVESVASLVRRLINTSAGAAPHLDTIAERMGISERTLKRRLQAEGTSFSEILSDWRRASAEHMLRHGDMPIADMAERLAFSDVSSFSQAFKRWTGQSPASYRRGAPADSHDD